MRDVLAILGGAAALIWIASRGTFGSTSAALTPEQPRSPTDVIVPSGILARWKDLPTSGLFTPILTGPEASRALLAYGEELQVDASLYLQAERYRTWHILSLAEMGEAGKNVAEILVKWKGDRGNPISVIHGPEFEPPAPITQPAGPRVGHQYWSRYAIDTDAAMALRRDDPSRFLPSFSDDTVRAFIEHPGYLSVDGNNGLSAAGLGDLGIVGYPSALGVGLFQPAAFRSPAHRRLWELTHWAWRYSMQPGEQGFYTAPWRNPDQAPPASLSDFRALKRGALMQLEGWPQLGSGPQGVVAKQIRQWSADGDRIARTTADFPGGSRELVLAPKNPADPGARTWPEESLTAGVAYYMMCAHLSVMGLLGAPAVPGWPTPGKQGDSLWGKPTDVMTAWSGMALAVGGGSKAGVAVAATVIVKLGEAVGAALTGPDIDAAAALPWHDSWTPIIVPASSLGWVEPPAHVHVPKAAQIAMANGTSVGLVKAMSGGAGSLARWAGMEMKRT